MLCDVCHTERTAGVYLEEGCVVVTRDGGYEPLGRFLRICWSCLTYDTVRSLGCDQAPSARSAGATAHRAAV